MAEKFRNKYRIPSARLKHWDYGSNAMYFVTLCTANRAFYFGNVVNGKMNLSGIGKIVETEWLNTFVIRQDMNLQMGEFVVMPNHFHAIISIGENQYNTKNAGDGVCDGVVGGDGAVGCGAVGDGGAVGRDAMHRVSTGETGETGITVYPNETGETNNTGEPPINDEYKNEFGPQSKNLASIMRGFKSAVTQYARINNIDFAWQSRFHDHIIRNDESYQRISAYIKNNPLNWVDDKFFHRPN